MADASDSKSDVGDHVRVQVPSSAVVSEDYENTKERVRMDVYIHVELFFLVFVSKTKSCDERST